MIPLAERWEAGVDEVIRRRGVPWHVTRLGARAEYHFRPTPPRDGAGADGPRGSRCSPATSTSRS